MLQVLTYGILGILAGWATHLVMPANSLSNQWIASLIGLDGALLGAYMSHSLLIEPGTGTTLFLVLLAAFALLSVYHTAHRRLLDASKAQVRTTYRGLKTECLN